MTRLDMARLSQKAYLRGVGKVLAVPSCHRGWKERSVVSGGCQTSNDYHFHEAVKSRFNTLRAASCRPVGPAKGLVYKQASTYSQQHAGMIADTSVGVATSSSDVACLISKFSAL